MLRREPARGAVCGKARPLPPPRVLEGHHGTLSSYRVVNNTTWGVLALPAKAAVKQGKARCAALAY